MSETPKFTVVDRRKFRADADDAPGTGTAAPPEPIPAPEVAASAAGPMLVEKAGQPAAVIEAAEPDLETRNAEEEQFPPAPSAEESRRQKLEYERSAERIDDLIRAQNPGVPSPEKIGFEHLVQQLYLSALMQLGAGTPEGQRPRVDIVGARQTIDLLGVLEERTKGNLTAEEMQNLDAALFELRMTFMELTRMISAQPLPPPPGGAKR